MSATQTVITEAAWQQQVIDLAHLLGWRTMHIRRSIGGRKQGWVTSTTVKGYPDLTLWHPKQHRFMVIELKSASGRLTEEQRKVLAELALAGVETHVYTPDQLDDVAAVLKAPVARDTAGAREFRLQENTGHGAPRRERSADG